MENLERMSLIELDKNEMSEINGGAFWAILGALVAGVIVGLFIKGEL